ncbi:MAG: hypothetical protein AAGC74_04760 [Verrucomicrobiota bacterium]
MTPGGPLPISAANIDQNFTFTVDYYIPSSTVMDADDTLYIQLNFNSAANGTTGANLAEGFINTSNATLDAWNTITLTGTVPATDDYAGSGTVGPGNPVDEVTAAILFVDGGFNGTPDMAAGVSLYLDNIYFEAEVDPSVNAPSIETLWKDEDPLSGVSTTNNGLLVSNVSTGPAIDADHPTAGELDHGVAGKYSNVNPGGPFTITNANYGQTYTMTVEYYIPSSTVMDGLDTLYVQMNFNSSANFTTGANLAAGFINTNNATLDAWNTITLTGNVPATDDYVGATASGPGNPVDSLSVSILFADGGFGVGTEDQAAGVSLYLDNICLEVGVDNNVAPPPTDILWKDENPLSGMSALGNGLVVNPVSTGPAIDADHPIVGELDHGAGPAGKFSSVNAGGALPITTEQHGEVFTFEVSYFIPSGTVMDGSDTLYIQLNFNSGAAGTTGANLAAGFITTSSAALDTWNTITLTSNVPATNDYAGSGTIGPGDPVDEVVANVIFVDGGFSGTADQAAGVSLYLDDICFEIAISEPKAITINSCSYDGANFIINYNTSFNDGGTGFSGADIYYSTDLQSWTADVFASSIGNNLEVIRPTTDLKRFYILVEPGATPAGFPPPPNDPYVAP